MRRDLRALTFLELMLAMTIMFLAISFLMGLFVSSSRSGVRSKQLSACNLLAQSKMEKLRAVPLTEISVGSDHFDGEFSEYLYSVELIDPNDFDGDGNKDKDLKILRLEVTAPCGVEFALTSLRQAIQPFIGVAADELGDEAILSLETETFPVIWRHPLSSMNNIYPDFGSFPGDVAADRNHTTLWAVDAAAGGVRSLGLSPMGVWSAPTAPVATTVPSGLSTDDNGAVLWMADEISGGLWSYTVATGVWAGPFVPASPLSSPRGVSVNQDGTVVWVASRDDDSLYAYRPSSNTWEAPLTCSSMSGLEGVAVNGSGDLVYAVDSKYLHLYDTNTGSWTQLNQPGKLRSDGAQGMDVSGDDSTLYIVATRGSFWHIDLTSLTFTEVWWRSQGF